MAAEAEAQLRPTQGNQASGTVRFVQQGDTVSVTATVSGLKAGAHGFHIHEKGDCSAPDGTSAGGHFNPMDKPHGHPDKAERHVGDMPMLEADANGTANLKWSTTGMTVDQGKTGIVGRAVIVHAAPDDFATQPTGNAGGRLACGVIEAKR